MTSGFSRSRPAPSAWSSASGRWREPGMWPASNSSSARTSTSWAATVSAGASDLHIKPGTRPRIRVEGELDELNGYPAVTRDELAGIAQSVLLSERKIHVLEEEGSADLSYDAPCGRFRVSAFRQRGGTSYIFRTIPDAPDFDEL